MVRHLQVQHLVDDHFVAKLLWLVEKFGVEPQDADNFRDTSRTSTGKMARISLPAPGTPIDNSLLGVFTFDRYGEMTGTIMVRDQPFPEEPLWA